MFPDLNLTKHFQLPNSVSSVHSNHSVNIKFVSLQDMNCGILHDLEMNATVLVFKPSYAKAEPPASYIGHILRVFFLF